MSYNRDYLMHYGVKGQKWGIRRFQNEDGSLTREGMARMQTGYSNAMSKVRKFGANTSGVLSRKQPKQSPTAKKEAKKKTRRMLMAAGGITLAAAGIAVAVHRRNKTTQNLIQLAKNSVHETYNKLGDGSPRNEYWKAHDSMAIDSRRKALKELGLTRRKSAKQFIKENKIAKRKTYEIIEQRTGPLVEGYHKTLSGKMKPITGHKLNRLKKKAARSFYV